MAHSESRSSSIREAQLALLTGSIYGGTHTLTGHPLDTIKSKMQIQLGYSNMTSVQVASKIYKLDGIRGFFKGCIPPLWGIKYELFGLRPMVFMSIIYSSICRCGFEGPIEYAKVMGQTGQKWVYRDIYRGFSWQIMRYFVVTAGISGGAYLFCWPLETLKNLSQSATPYPNATFAERINYLGGYKGLYRGVWPGTLCGALRNGCAMVSMVYAQKLATRLGLRD
eukprot:gene18600-24328_t